MLTRTRLEELLAALPGKRIAVIGDFCMDIYWHADMTRSQLSRETPRFPLPVVREEFSAGGASNVAWNLAELGVGTVQAITLFGDDWRGRELSRVLAERHGVVSSTSSSPRAASPRPSLSPSATASTPSRRTPASTSRTRHPRPANSRSRCWRTWRMRCPASTRCSWPTRSTTA